MTRGYGPYGPFCHKIFKIKCNVHLGIVKLMLKNVSINALYSFYFGTLEGGLYILPQAGI